jgi:hypothetical protein
LRRSNPAFLLLQSWIASQSLSSGAHTRDPLARNDGDAYIRNNDCRSIFPVPVFGNSPMNRISRGYLYGSSFALT